MKKKFTDEELDDEEGMLLQPVVTHIRRGKVSESSDEDFPEAFTMMEGKSMAQQLRSEERASGRRIASEVKKKRQEKAASRKAQKTAEKASLSPVEPEAGDKIDEYRPEQSVINGLLDDSIVQFLSARERAKLDDFGGGLPSPGKAVNVKRAKLKKERKDDGRVQVVDLSRDTSFAEEHDALAFKQGLLYGGRLRRDRSMLRKLIKVS